MECSLHEGSYRGDAYGPVALGFLAGTWGLFRDRAAGAHGFWIGRRADPKSQVNCTKKNFRARLLLRRSNSVGPLLESWPEGVGRYSSWQLGSYKKLNPAHH